MLPLIDSELVIEPIWLMNDLSRLSCGMISLSFMNGLDYGLISFDGSETRWDFFRNEETAAELVGELGELGPHWVRGRRFSGVSVGWDHGVVE